MGDLDIFVIQLPEDDSNWKRLKNIDDAQKFLEKKFSEGGSVSDFIIVAGERLFVVRRVTLKTLEEMKG